MALQVTRGVLCKVPVRDELEILRQARLDAQRIVNRLGLLYGDVSRIDGAEGDALRSAHRTRGRIGDLITQATATVDEEAISSDDSLFARAARREMEVRE